MNTKTYNYINFIFIVVLFSSCVTNTSIVTRKENNAVPEAFNQIKDSSNTAQIKWNEFFTDPNLIALIDTALKNNQELNIVKQEIEIARNEARARKGEYLPYLYLGAGAGAEKSGEFTRNGAVEKKLDIDDGKAFPDPYSDFLLSANVSWEIDIWKKLRNARKAAVGRYLATIEGRNFMVTHLVSEIADSYYELLALDNQLLIVKNNIEILNDALEIVKLQKAAAKVSELGVKRFEAELLKTESMQYDIQQKIIETENKINFLVGRFPTPIKRNADEFMTLIPKSIKVGIPSQLLQNRPDIKQTELELAAAKLDVKSAKANFYPSLAITSGIGYNAFNPAYFIKTPQSLIYTIAGDLVAPLINRNAIKAKYYSASARQMQTLYKYEQTILNSYIEVLNQVNKISNLENSFNLRNQQVQTLTTSISISKTLFRNARADYMEVLMTQRDALESKFELIETKQKQLIATIDIYRALGGGWK